MQGQYLSSGKRHFVVFLVIILFITAFGGVFQSAAEPDFNICFLPESPDVQEQGGLTVGALGGLTIGPLALTADALALTIGALALTAEPLDIDGDGTVEQVFITPAGQALTIGALDALTADELGLTAEALTILQAEIAANPYDFTWLSDRLGYVGSGVDFLDKNVALLILDDFGDTPTEIRHGERVSEVAQDFINGNGLAGNIHIYEIDITVGDNFLINGPDGVANKLGNVVSSLSESYSRFVINMSFGLIPCDQTLTVDDKTINWNINEYIDYTQGESELEVDCDTLQVYASEVVSYTPGTKKNGDPINDNRDDPNFALGEPDRQDKDINSETGEGFVSLGFDGTLVLALFEPTLYDPDLGCNYLEIWETSFNDPSPAEYPEKALVEVSSDGESYFSLGEVTLDTIFTYPPEGAPLSYQYIRLTNTSNPDDFGGSADGYDVDGVVGYRPVSPSVGDYFSALDPTLTIEEVAELLEQLNNPELNPNADDPSVNELLALLQGYLDLSAGPGDFAAMPFGASGNYRAIVTAGQYDAVSTFPADFGPVPPLLPAYGSQVMAICAHVNDTFDLAQFSHDGNFCVPGAWYTFDDGASSAGSSFSSPVAAVYGATWLTYADPDACDFTIPGSSSGRTPLKPIAADWMNANVPTSDTPLDCEPPVTDPSGEVPLCDGVPATIYVAGGKVVGGPDDGDTYTPWSDTLRGTNGDDVIVGSDQADKIRGRNGNDLICGGLGDDDIHGQNGDDRLIGGTDGTVTPSVDPSGQDKIRGGNGNDTIYGGNDDDDLRGDNDDDIVIGGAGNDTIRGGNGNDHLNGSNGHDTVRGDNGDDKLWGEHGDDDLIGGGGNDELHGQLGADCLVGNNGDDEIYGFQKANPNGTELVGESVPMRPFTSGNCRPRDGEQPFYNDIIFGGNGNDYMDGGDANDYINGGRGDLDRMFGGAGEDVIRDNDGNIGAHGGPGNDYINVRLANGWDNNDDPNDPRYDGKLSGGYGNDLVQLDNKSIVNLFINITGDERDNPGTVPPEGNQDCLVLKGNAVNGGSVIIKFEETPNNLNQCSLNSGE